MRNAISHFICILQLAGALASVTSRAQNLVLPEAGEVVVEFYFSDSGFNNQLCVQQPASVAGCYFPDDTTNLGRRFNLGTHPAGTVFEFRVRTGNCNGDVWSSDRTFNSDGSDHAQVSPITPCGGAGGRIWRYAWEDLAYPNGACSAAYDGDFNDINYVVRLNGDADQDGIWDEWEACGSDPDYNGRDFTGGVDLPLHQEPYNAVVGTKDIFVQIDWMNVAGNHNHAPLRAGGLDVIAAAQAAFANANALYPDGTTRGINLHLDDGALADPNYACPPACGHAVEEDACLNMSGLASLPPVATDLDTIKAANFHQSRRGIFHYALFGHEYSMTGTCPGTCQTSSGIAELPGNDFTVTLCGGGQTARNQLGTLLHEFGHNLCLRHGGIDDVNYKPDYLSVMNYSFQFPGLGPLSMGAYVGGTYDYSRGQLINLNEASLNETVGINPGHYNPALGTFFYCETGCGARTTTGEGGIDWNCDGDGAADLAVAGSVNRDRTGAGACLATRTDLAGFSDWGGTTSCNSQGPYLRFQESSNMEDGVHPSVDDVDPDRPPPPTDLPEITTEVCDGIDNDSDGQIDEGFDMDGDGVVDCRDNCAAVPNPDQGDGNGDGIGDACALACTVNGAPGGACATCAPRGQGYWHRQCLGCDYLKPGSGKGQGKGNGPGPHPDMTCVQLAGLFQVTDPTLASSGQTTCEALDAQPASSDCEKAYKQYAALLLNLASGKIGECCTSNSGVTSGLSVEIVKNIIPRLIQEGKCEAAAAMADSVNSGDACSNAAPAAAGSSCSAAGAQVVWPALAVLCLLATGGPLSARRRGRRS